MSYQMHKN